MYAILLLTATFTGQCGPRGCPAPVVARPYATPVYAPAAPTFAPVALRETPARVEGRDYYVVKLHEIKHDGLTFKVRGYVKDARTGIVTWEPGDEYNRLSYAAAVARKAALDSEKRPDPVPSALPEPAPGTGDDKAVKQDVGKALNFGIDPGRLKTEPTYTLPSAKARRFVQEAREDAEGPGKIHVTVIGSDDNRAPVVNDLLTHPAFAKLKPSMLIQGYTPDEWPVDPKLGFQTDGTPSIIVQTAKGPRDLKGGRVIYRAASYKMGPDALSEAIRKADSEALRKADPDYRPNVDPGPPKPRSPDSDPDPCPLGFDHSHWPYLVGAVALLVVLFKLPRKEG